MGVVASASPAADPALVEGGIEILRAAGLEVHLAPNVHSRRGYLAGSPQERASDLHWAFDEPDIDLVLELRGGYGCGHVIPLLDLDRIAAHPKTLLGMSDITLLHLALGSVAGITTLWGPMLHQLPQASQYSRDRLFAALAGEGYSVDPAPGEPELQTLVGGTARGRLVGGTTTLVAASLGTPYEIDTTGRLLLVEDVDSEPYEVDRSLTQLEQAGKLEVAAGFVVSEHADVAPGPDFGSDGPSLMEVLRDKLVPLGLPTVYGFALGHGAHLATVPLGGQAELDADSPRLTLLGR